MTFVILSWDPPLYLILTLAVCLTSVSIGTVANYTYPLAALTRQVPGAVTTLAAYHATLCFPLEPGVSRRLQVCTSNGWNTHNTTEQSWTERQNMNSMKLVIPLRFISWKKTPNDAVTPWRQSQFTPKMKANAVPRLLSSLVWIDQYNECNGMTSFI